LGESVSLAAPTGTKRPNSNRSSKVGICAGDSAEAFPVFRSRAVAAGTTFRSRTRTVGSEGNGGGELQVSSTSQENLSHQSFTFRITRTRGRGYQPGGTRAGLIIKAPTINIDDIGTICFGWTPGKARPPNDSSKWRTRLLHLQLALAVANGVQPEVGDNRPCLRMPTANVLTKDIARGQQTARPRKLVSTAMNH